jgi:hypothetical protein
MRAPTVTSRHATRGLAASSPAYELYAPRALRARALARIALGVILMVLTLGRTHA